MMNEDAKFIDFVTVYQKIEKKIQSHVICTIRSLFLNFYFYDECLKNEYKVEIRDLISCVIVDPRHRALPLLRGPHAHQGGPLHPQQP
jgi:hypothetical protein